MIISENIELKNYNKNKKIYEMCENAAYELYADIEYNHNKPMLILPIRI